MISHLPIFFQYGADQTKRFPTTGPGISMIQFHTL